MKTSRTTLKLAAAIAGMALFLGAAAATGIDRGNEMVANGFTGGSQATPAPDKL